MHSIVKRLYNQGLERPRPRPEVEADPGDQGELRFGAVGLVPMADLVEQDDEFVRSLIPVLVHAWLVTMSVDMMRFRGIEREKGGEGYEQGWLVRIIDY